jgi:hypothetical protein
MKNILLLCAFIFLGLQSYSQTQSEILQEGRLLYQNAVAARHGTEIFLSQHADRKESIGGYVSYIAGSDKVCVLFSKDAKPRAIGAVTETTIQSTERELTKNEQDLVTIRQIAVREYNSDTLFKSYQKMNPNFIAISDGNGKRVYILTTPEEPGVIVFGNDYLLTFDSNNTLKQKRRLHHDLTSIRYNLQDKKPALTTTHLHQSETGDLITATDICTLLLHAPLPWGQHFVISPKNVSIWDCADEDLIIVTKDAWDKAAAAQKLR